MAAKESEMALPALYVPAHIYLAKEGQLLNNIDFPSQRQQDTKVDIELAQPAEQSLPPVDGGKDAWCFLAAIFIFEAVIWGL